MALAQKKIKAILFVLTLASSRAEEPAASSSSLEAAKRDLLALPNSPQSSGASRQDGLKIDVPNLPNTAGSGEISKPNTSLLPPNSTDGKGDNPLGSNGKPPSEGWLIDAFKAADTQAKAQRAADDQHARDLQRVQGKTGNAAAVNPFAPYMSQWLSPHDPVLLQITGPNQAGAASASTNDSLAGLAARAADGMSLATNAAGSSPVTPSPFTNVSAGMQNPAAGGVTTNPYLPPDATIGGGVNSFSSPSALPNNGKLGAATSATPLIPSGARKPKLAEPAYAPPTAPLIDERKYFPQLHRF